MRVTRGRGDNRDRDRGYKEKHQHGQTGRSDKFGRERASDRDDNWRARTSEEANAAIDRMSGTVGPDTRGEGRPGGRPQAAPAPSPAMRGADASSSHQDAENAAELQDSPSQEAWPALGSAMAPTAEAENAGASPGQAVGSSSTAPSLMNCCAQALPANGLMAAIPAGVVMPMGPGSEQMGQMVVMAMAAPYGTSADSQVMAADDAALPSSMRPAVKAPAAALANASVLAAGGPVSLGAGSGPPGSSAQKQMLPVKASTKAYARSNAKAPMPKVQAPFAVPAAVPPEDLPNRAMVPNAAVALLVPTPAPESGLPGAPGPSSSGVTMGIGLNALAKAAPAPAPVPAHAGHAPAPGAGAGEGDNTSGSVNNEAVVEAGEGDGSELKTLLGRGAAPPSGDADAKLGRGSVRLQGVEDWVLYLQPRREGESQQTPAPVRRAVAGARGRGRGRLVNLKLDRVRGAGRATAPATSGEDGHEASVPEAAEETPQPSLETPVPPTAIETPCGSAGDGAAEANAAASAGTSVGSQETPVPSSSTTHSGLAATASTALGRGGSSIQHPRRRGRAWEDIDGMLDLDDEDSAQITSSVGVAAVSSTSDGSSLPVSGDTSTAAAERRTRSPATGSPATPCVEASPATASTAAAPCSELQASEDASQAFAATGAASAVSSTSGAGSSVAAIGTAASAERRPSASEASAEGSQAAASTVAPAASSEAQPIEASSSSTSPAPAGAAASSTASSTRPRPEAPAAASATSAAAPASGTSSGSATGLMRLAMDLPAGAGEAGGAGGWAGGGGGGGWERNFRRDDELLRACGLWCKKVEADGACLFRAFSDQLEGDGGSKHLQYREKCVTYLEEYRAEFEAFITEDFKRYCAKLREPAAWGGHVEAQALSRALGVNALIHVPNEADAAQDVPEKAIEVLNFGEDAPCVQLCFHPRYHSGPHYNSVRSSGDKGDGIPSVSNVKELRERMLEVLRTRRQRQGGTSS